MRMWKKVVKRFGALLMVPVLVFALSFFGGITSHASFVENVIALPSNSVNLGSSFLPEKEFSFMMTSGIGQPWFATGTGDFMRHYIEFSLSYDTVSFSASDVCVIINGVRYFPTFYSNFYSLEIYTAEPILWFSVEGKLLPLSGDVYTLGGSASLSGSARVVNKSQDAYLSGTYELYTPPSYSGTYRADYNTVGNTGSVGLTPNASYNQTKTLSLDGRYLVPEYVDMSAVAVDLSSMIVNRCLHNYGTVSINVRFFSLVSDERLSQHVYDATVHQDLQNISSQLNTFSSAQLQESQKQTAALTTFDGKGSMDSNAGVLNTAVVNYDTVESDVFSSANLYADDFKPFESFAFGTGLVSAISICSSFIASIISHMGDFSSIFTIGMALVFVGIIVGLWRFKGS